MFSRIALLLAFGIIITCAAAFTFRPARLAATRLLVIPSRLYQQNLGFSSASTPESNISNNNGYSSESEQEKWDRMYYQNAQEQKDDCSNNFVAAPIRVVSFDLDNTLWKTGASILAANDALSKWLDERNIVQPQRVEVYMGEIFRANKAKYGNSPDAKAATYLTKLRIDAMEYLLQLDEQPDSIANATELAIQAFNVWTDARHEACANNLAENVVETLQRIRQIQTHTTSSTLQQSPPPNILVCAITDGNSNPQQIKVLSDVFDFIVNAEDVGVSKPEKTIYLQAVKQAMDHPALHGLKTTSSSVDDSSIEDIIGPWWVHIGDDFIKDIVAAKTLNMRTIWMRELVANKNKVDQRNDEKANIAAYYPSTNQARNSDDGNNNNDSDNKPTTSSSAAAISDSQVQDFVQKIADMKSVKMSIGADDYLASTLEQEYADATIDKFAHLHDLLTKWHHEGIQYEQRKDNGNILTVYMPDSDGNMNNGLQKSSANDVKFCTSCGTKLPAKSKFCSACGEKQ